MRVDPATVWFSDVVDRYFVRSGGRKRQQADAIAQDYEPFAKAAGLQSARLPPRPGVEALVQLATNEHATRVRGELIEAAAPVVVTLGEEARRVLLAIADEATGPPTEPLEGRRLAGQGADSYGASGSVGRRRPGDELARAGAPRSTVSILGGVARRLDRSPGKVTPV